MDVNCSTQANESNIERISEKDYSIEIYKYVRVYTKGTKAIEVNVVGHSLRLLPWLWVTSVITILALMLRLHEAHPLVLIAIIFVHIFVLLYRIQSKVVSEKLLVVSGLGVQTTLTFITGKCRTKFIPWAQLIDIIIAETITMQQVLFFMAVLTKSGDTKLEEIIHPLFTHAWPRLYCLQEIYRCCHETLSSCTRRKPINDFATVNKIS